MREATGIDLASIINAESYEAKVNKNVTLTGLDDVNVVVKSPEDKKVSTVSSSEVTE
jgi:flotillin